MGIFLKRSRAANFAVCGRIVPNFKRIRDITRVLRTCKNEVDPIKNEGARVLVRMVYFIRNQHSVISVLAIKQEFHYIDDAD